MKPGGLPLLLVEDEPLVAEGIARALRSTAIVEHVSTLRAALEALDSGRTWAGAIVDIGLPDGDGLDVIRRARLERPLLPILVLTAHDDVERINEAHRLGAGYACKPCDPEDLLRFVAHARSFQEVDAIEVQRAVAALAVECGLTPREKDVVVSMIRHRTRAEVLRELDVTENTLKGQIRSVLRKTGHDSMQTLSRALLRSTLVEK